MPIASLTFPREQEDIAYQELRALAAAIAEMAGGTPIREPVRYGASTAAAPRKAKGRRRTP